MNPARPRPVRILRGTPTDEELAAVLMVLRLLTAVRTRRAADPGAIEPPHGYRRTPWVRRQPGWRGPGVWRRSGWH
ncbi:acyl-CoA carboxylase subunit epsilon [Streptomyces uncialis]|uniref:acyl-CoA carboxylase subunit epsilon n=1 Tax=Streptomyces uncialis TaxID=1048205 RepID=UPI003811BF3F